MLVKCKEAAIMIEKIARGAIQRPKYRQALKEAEEEARVNSKLAALQKRLKEAEMKWIQADKQRIAAEKRAEGIVGSPEGELHLSLLKHLPRLQRASCEEEKKSDSSPNQQELIHESNEYVHLACHVLRAVLQFEFTNTFASSFIATEWWNISSRRCLNSRVQTTCYVPTWRLFEKRTRISRSIIFRWKRRTRR